MGGGTGMLGFPLRHYDFYRGGEVVIVNRQQKKNEKKKKGLYLSSIIKDQ